MIIKPIVAIIILKNIRLVVFTVLIPVLLLIIICLVIRSNRMKKTSHENIEMIPNEQPVY